MNLDTWKIYRITNNTNNKIYIGITQNIEKRWTDHKRDAIKKYKNRFYAFQAALSKYGEENFTWEVIAECANLKDANYLETSFIKEYNSLVPNGYNIKDGGGSNKLHQLSKDKIREKLKIVGSFVGKKGKDHPNYGTKLSEKRKKYLSDKFSGDNGANKKINSQIAREIYITFMNNKNFYATDLMKIYPLKKGAILNILNKKCWKQATKDLPDIDIKSRLCGENCKNSKITEKNVKDIIYDRNINNLTYRELSIKYSLSPSHLYNIVNRKTWMAIKD